MVFSNLQTLSLKRFFLAQGVFLVSFIALSFFFKEEILSFYLGGFLGEGYMMLVFFIGMALFKQGSKTLTLCIIILKWPILALLLYNLLQVVDRLSFVLALSYAMLGFGLSFLVGRRN